jgi:hypothetical protein
MTDFKEGDKVKLKHFKNKKDYMSQSKGKGWNYETFIRRTNEIMDNIFTIKFINSIDDIFFTESSQNSQSYISFQLEKVCSLKDRLALVRELIK